MGILCPLEAQQVNRHNSPNATEHRRQHGGKRQETLNTGRTRIIICITAACFALVLFSLVGRMATSKDASAAGKALTTIMAPLDTATATDTPIIVPTDTPTPIPTNTPTPTPTPITPTPTNTPTPTPVPPTPMPTPIPPTPTSQPTVGTTPIVAPTTPPAPTATHTPVPAGV